jgi:4-amino-4-deoxy-L-arabinose transferase-like glycosyltransferase
MAKARTLVPRNGYLIGLIVIILVGAFFRLWHLSTLPPGLSAGEAQVGLAAYNLLHHGVWPSFNLNTGGSPVLVVLESLAIGVLGLSAWVLRLVPAAIGIVAIGTTYLWVRTWFGRRAGILAAFLMTVTPWAVTLSRNVQPATLAVLLLTLLLWQVTCLWHHQTTKNLIQLGIVVGIAGLSGPVGWGTLLVTLVAALGVIVGHATPPKLKAISIWTGLAAVAVLPALIVALGSRAHGRTLITATSLGHYLGGIGTTFLAFQVHGDDNYLHNLGGEPLLNVFVGIMFIAGILVSITRWKQRPERALLLGSVAALLPAFIAPQTAPDAARLILFLPLALAFAAIGIGYMLEVWYATFPINSAARLTGQVAIMLLLGLTAFQGYTQYFVAWADSSETHRAYSDTATGMAEWVKHQAAGTQLVIVADRDDATALRYRLITVSNYQVVGPDQLVTALKVRPLHLVLTTTWRDQVVTELKAVAAGGTLQSHQSSFDEADLYYTYDLP